MKKFRYVFIVIFSFFLGFIQVFAGVCDGKTTSSQGYCNLGTTYVYPNKTTTNTYLGRYFASGGSEGYLGYAYEATSGTFSGTSEYAFCLDPGKDDPDSYSFGRELDLKKYSFDKDVYKTYQYYVNNVAYAKNTDTYDENIQKYLAFTDVALRAFTYNAGFELENLKTVSPYYYYSILPYITGNYKSSINKGGCKIVDKTLSKFGNKSGDCGFAWASEKKKVDEAKEYYKKIKDISGLYWENPLNIVPSVSYDESTQLYTFSFKVSFKKGDYVYFGVSASEKHYDYNIGYGNAYFSYNGMTINDGAYDLSNAVSVSTDTTISGMSGGVVNPNANNDITFTLTMRKDIYDSIMADKGKVYVTMKYQTYHPMNIDNVFINYINDRSVGSSTLNQRMIVFTKYDKEKTISSSGSVEENKPLCEQNGSDLYYNGVKVGIDEYKQKCGCLKIDYDLLNDIDKSLYNSFLCPVREEPTYSGGLTNCEEDNGSGEVSRTVSYNKLSSYDTEGIYSTLVCQEKIEMDKLVNSDLTTKAGMYFGLGTYPEITATKECTIEVDYERWYDDYEDKLKDELGAYNAYIKDYRIDNAACSDKQCCNSIVCYGYGKVCYYSYERYYYDNGSIEVTDGGSGSWDTCLGGTKPGTDTENNESAFMTEYNDLVNHFNVLRDTNKFLNQYASHYDFYDFDSELSFYYEQEYSKSSIGIKRNDERSSYGNADDSLFKSKLESEQAGGNYNSVNFTTNNDKYDFISLDGDEPYGVSSNLIGSGLKGNDEYSITRSMVYEYSYSPSLLKYVDSYSSKISTYSGSLKNPIELGNVYDIDYSAVAKTNTNYYEFSKLGEKNMIFEHFTNSDNTASFEYNDSIYEKNGMQRFCTYETTNELLKTCENDSCETKINVVYRIVDPNNIDPNGRIFSTAEDSGFWNWKNTKGYNVKDEIETSDTYNPDNIEYSFELDSSTIKEIREYNEYTNYSDFDLDCDDDGNKCKSDFVTSYANVDEFGKIAGRDSWKD